METVVSMLRRFHHASQYCLWLPFDGLSVRETVQKVMDAEDAALFVLDDLTGCIAVMAYDHPFSGDRMASELFLWCEPEARGQGVGLVKRAEAWAREVGARRILFVAPDREARTHTLYERLGYEPVERHFVRGLS
jgi:GNAT superfamily N-acetyltransferase